MITAKCSTIIAKICRQNDPEDLYSLFNTHENFGASTRHQLVFRDNANATNVSTRFQNFIKAPPIRRIKLMSPKERQKQLMEKKLRKNLEETEDNSLFSDLIRSNDKKKRQPKVSTILTPDKSKSLFDQDGIISANDLIDDVVDYENGDRRFEDDYGQFLMDSLTNETYFQDSKGKNTQIIINLTHNPRQAL